MQLHMDVSRMQGTPNIVLGLHSHLKRNNLDIGSDFLSGLLMSDLSGNSKHINGILKHGRW